VPSSSKTQQRLRWEREREREGIACPEIVVNKSLFYLATTTTSTTTAPFGNQMAQA
jgi:hypothetical protein